MKKIETQEEMIKWANEVNNGVTIARKCELQDIWAHSDILTLKKLWLASNADRKLILCSVYNTMSYDEVEKLLVYWANTKAQSIIDIESEQIGKRDLALFKREQEFKNSMKPYWKRIQDLKSNLTYSETKRNMLRERVNELEKQLAEYRRNSWENEAKANKYDAIKRALA